MVLKGGDWVQQLQPDCRFTDVLIRDEYREVLRAIMGWFLHGDQVAEGAVEVGGVQPAPLGDLENPFLSVPTDHISKTWAFILLGNPGIGKTVMLYFLLVLRLQARLPTIYQSRSAYLYYFDDNGVSLIHLTQGVIATDIKAKLPRSTWCLVDSNQSLDTVPVFIQDLDLFIIQASSPRPHHFKWMYKATRSVLRYFMKSWTLSELLVGRCLQLEVYSEAEVESFSNRYGTSARLVYTHASHPLKYEAILADKLGEVTYQMLDSLVRMTSNLDLSAPISHLIILPSPDTSRDTFVTTFPTRYIYEKLRDRLSIHKLEAIARLYDVYSRVPRARASAGFMLEDAVHVVFPRGGEWSLVKMTPSNRKGSKFTHWKDPGTGQTPQYLHLGSVGCHIAIDTDPNPVETTYAPLPVINYLNDAPLQLKDGYYCPSSDSQETFDAFIYESAAKTATVFQVTTAHTHSVKEGGIRWLQGLGVERFRYIAVSTPDTPLDLPFPNKWNEPLGPLISEKYLLTVKSLLTSLPSTSPPKN